ncbi:MAG: hypothetical protein ABFC96_05315, partial [Thermoguttaceae bacterium]
MDLMSTAFGGGLTHGRRYCNQLQQNDAPASANVGVGFNWLTSSQPSLTSVDSQGSVAVTFDSNEAYWFKLDGDTYAARYGAKHTLAYGYDAAVQEYVYTLTAPDGRKWQFYDLATGSNPSGALIKSCLPGGQTITATYDGTTHQLSRLEQTDGTTTESFEYAYQQVGETPYMIASVTLVRDNVSLQRVIYAYYITDSAGKGTAGDLKSATQQDYVDGAWVTRDVTYYRYYTQGESSYGFAHGLKYVFGPQGYRDMIAAGVDLDTADDAHVAPYADNHYQYDGYQRAITAQSAGGSQAYSFSYLPTPHTPVASEYNQWSMKTDETRPDLSKLTVYTNSIGQPLLKKLTDASDTESWIEYFVYDANARQTEHWSPAAVASFTDTGGASSDEIVVTATGEGLIRLTTYYGANPSPAASESTAGGVEGYVEFQKVKNGSGGTEIKISETKYKKHTVGSTDICYVAEQTVYQEVASGGITTSFANKSWYSCQVQQRTTTLPAVTAGKNGSNSPATRKEYFDEYGNLT